MLCYTAAVPFLLWAILLATGVVGDDGTRVPFCVVEGVAIAVSIHGLRQKYRRHDAR